MSRVSCATELSGATGCDLWNPCTPKPWPGKICFAPLIEMGVSFFFGGTLQTGGFPFGSPFKPENTTIVPLKKETPTWSPRPLPFGRPGHGSFLKFRVSGLEAPRGFLRATPDGLGSPGRGHAGQQSPDHRPEHLRLRVPHAGRRREMLVRAWEQTTYP